MQRKPHYLTNNSQVTHTYTARVYLEDVDAVGCMYHANHLRFCERARTEMLRHHGFIHAKNIDHNKNFVVRHLNINYQAPILLDDTIDIETEIIVVKISQLVLQQTIKRNNIPVGQLVVQLVFVDNTFKILKLPHMLRTICQSLCIKSNEDIK